MSNKEYFEKLIQDLEYIQVNPRGVQSFSNKIAQDATTPQPKQTTEQDQQKPSQPMTEEQVKANLGVEVGEWVLKWGGIGVGAIVATGLGIKVIQNCYSLFMKLGGREVADYIAKPLFNFIKTNGASGIEKLSEVLARSANVASKAEGLASSAATEAGAAAEAGTAVAGEFSLAGLSAAEAATAGSTTAAAAASGVAGTSLVAIAGGLLLAATVGAGIGMLINHFAGNWIDDKIWKLFGKEDETKQLSSPYALRIVQLFKANKQPIPSTEEMQKYTKEYLEIFKNLVQDAANRKASVKRAQSKAQMWQEKALEEFAKRHKLQYFSAPQAKPQAAPTAPGTPPAAPGQATPQPGAQTNQPTTKQVSFHKESPYEVKQGDTLSQIAARMYSSNDPAGWKTIAEFNKLPDPDKIQVGQKLQIPAQIKQDAQAVSNYKAEVQKPATPTPGTTPAPAPTQAPAAQQSQTQPAPAAEKQKPTGTLVQEYGQALSSSDEAKKSDAFNGLIQNMQTVARTGDPSLYLKHLQQFPVSEETADQHDYQILKETLSGYSGLRQLLANYSKMVNKRTFEQLDQDYQNLGMIANIFERAGMKNEAKLAQQSRLLASNARDRA